LQGLKENQPDSLSNPITAVTAKLKAGGDTILRVMFI
jgi:hypothetical protein